MNFCFFKYKSPVTSIH